MSDGANTTPSTGLRAPWRPGESGNPSGRKPLPEWLKGKTEALLRLQADAALEGVITVQADDGEVKEKVPAKLRLEIAERLLNRLLGMAPAAPEDAAQRARIWDTLIELHGGGPPPAQLLPPTKPDP